MIEIFDLSPEQASKIWSKPAAERGLPKAALARVGKGAESWIALTNGIVGEGRSPSTSPTPTTRSLQGGTRS
jgi:hypothetical protein